MAIHDILKKWRRKKGEILFAAVNSHVTKEKFSSSEEHQYVNGRLGERKDGGRVGN